MIRLWLRIPLILGLVALVAACNTGTDDPEPEDNDFYVAFEADTVQLRYNDGENSYGNGPGVSTYSDLHGRLHSEFSTYIRSAFHPDYEKDILTIRMVRFYSDTAELPYGQRFLMFDEGTYPYGSWNEDSTNVGANGAVIIYTDHTGKVWSSDLLYGTQESWASFEINDHRAVDEPLFGAKTKGTFNCRVFDGLGGHIDLRNGQFHARTIMKQ